MAMQSASGPSDESNSSPQTDAGPQKLGRRGDPRMHRAVAARLANPKLSLLEALQLGGFDTKASADCGGDGVTLSQRKNQLSRRLRLLRQSNKSDASHQMMLHSLGHNLGGSMSRFGAEPGDSAFAPHSTLGALGADSLSELSGEDAGGIAQNAGVKQPKMAHMNSPELAAAQAAAVKAIKARAANSQERRISQVDRGLERGGTDASVEGGLSSIMSGIGADPLRMGGAPNFPSGSVVSGVPGVASGTDSPMISAMHSNVSPFGMGGSNPLLHGTGVLPENAMQAQAASAGFGMHPPSLNLHPLLSANISNPPGALPRNTVGPSMQLPGANLADSSRATALQGLDASAGIGPTSVAAANTSNDENAYMSLMQRQHANLQQIMQGHSFGAQISSAGQGPQHAGFQYNFNQGSTGSAVGGLGLPMLMNPSAQQASSMLFQGAGGGTPGMGIQPGGGFDFKEASGSSMAVAAKKNEGGGSTALSSNEGLAATEPHGDLSASSLSSDFSQKEENKSKDKVQVAVKQYITESASLLSKCMVDAGFEPTQTRESSQSYVEVASLALEAESQRVKRLRLALEHNAGKLKVEKIGTKKEQTDSSGDGGEDSVSAWDGGTVEDATHSDEELAQTASSSLHRTDLEPL